MDIDLGSTGRRRPSAKVDLTTRRIHGGPKSAESMLSGWSENSNQGWQPVLAFLRDAQWLTRGRIFWYSTALIAGTVAVMGWVLSGHGMADPMGRPVGTDFLRLWTASYALLNGEDRAMYDPNAFFALERAVTQPPTPDFYPWNYPPSSLVITYPLAMVPYLQSLVIWLALGLAAYLAALWRIFPKPLALWVGLAFPAVFWTVTHGQNSFLTTSVFCWGLLQLPRRPVLAGILFGVLAFKPHLGLLLPVALLTGRHWRALAVAAATAVVFAAISVVLFGASVWVDFLASAAPTRAMLESGLNLGHYYKMQSVFAASRLLGSPVFVAYTLQALAALGAAAVVVWAWRRRSGDADLKNAALMAATPLSTAFIFDYDLMLLAPAIAWLARRGIMDGASPFERTTLVAVFFTPFVSRVVGMYTHLLLAPIFVAALVAVIVRRIRSFECTKCGKHETN
jgi:alpha-1,2-mannosyltransferase